MTLLVLSCLRLFVSSDGNAPLTPADLARRLVLNPHDSSRQLQVQDDKPPGPGALSFKIPPRGSFCLSPLQDWPDTLSELGTATLIHRNDPELLLIAVL